MLDVSHNPMLVMASLAVSLMAGFTGLSLLHGASDMSLERRKLVVSLSAIVLGGGIWSMHFIAMLGMELPIDFYYDPLTTLISALVAILVVGLALLVLHFRERTWLSKAIAGALIGLGILAMHYLGMSGIRRCLPLYTVGGVTVAVLGSVALSIGAVWIAYGQRTKRNILLGTACFGLAVFAVHFVAMAGTSFVAVEGAEDLFPLIDNNLLAFIVTLGSFLICGGFLLNTATFAIAESNARQASLAPDVPVETEASVVQDENGRSGTQKAVMEASAGSSALQIPFERQGKTYFITYEDVAAIRAEGHYTVVYSKLEKLFCPWSISEAAKRLTPGSFIQTHRSYLVNPRHVTGFERKKDNGVCFFDEASSLDKVPVSRSRLPEIKQALGLA